MQETWVLSLGWGDPLEKGMAIHSSILAFKIPTDRGDWRTTVGGVSKSTTKYNQVRLSTAQQTFSLTVYAPPTHHTMSARKWDAEGTTTGASTHGTSFKEEG